jgi:hypothetical protein
MKIYIIILNIFVLSICNSQIIDINNKYSDNFIDVNGAYYKDINNVFATFEGDWLYSITNTDGTITSLRFKVKKLENQPYHDPVANINYTQDVLIVGYQYVENNIEKVNSLNIVDQDINFINCSLSGDVILLPNESPICSNCSSNEKRVELLYYEPNSKSQYRNLILRKTMSGINEVLEIKFYTTYHKMKIANNPFPVDYGYFNIPNQEFTLIKQ